MVTATNRRLLLELCAEVLRGGISLEDFEARRPSPEPANHLVAQVVEDLEDGLVHTPSRLRGGVDRRAWQRSTEHTLVYLDYWLLSLCQPEHTDAELLRCRSAIEDSFEHPLGKDELRRQVERCLSSPGEENCADGRHD